METRYLGLPAWRKPSRLAWVAPAGSGGVASIVKAGRPAELGEPGPPAPGHSPAAVRSLWLWCQCPALREPHVPHPRTSPRYRKVGPQPKHNVPPAPGLPRPQLGSISHGNANKLEHNQHSPAGPRSCSSRNTAFQHACMPLHLCPPPSSKNRLREVEGNKNARRLSR